MQKIWPFSYYFWQFAGITFLTPNLVLYYQSQGFGGPEIGVLTGIAPLVTLFFAPLWTGLADATRRHRLVLTLTMIGTCVALVVFPACRAFWPVLVVVVMYSLFNSPVSSLVDSATMNLLGPDRDKYGRMRLGGSLGIALAGPIAGRLVQRYGLNMAFWASAGVILMAMGAAWNIWTPAAEPRASGHIKVTRGSRALMTNPRWLLFLVGAFAGGLALTITNTYLFAYFKELGAAETSMGFALSLTTVFEVPILFFGNRLLHWLKAERLFLLALAVMAARMLLMAGAGTVTQAMAIQLLAGLAYPMMWMGGVTNAAENAPPGLAATAQGIFVAVLSGIGCSAGGFIGGPLLATFGARALFLFFGVVVLAVAALVAVAQLFVPAVRPRTVTVGKG